jgi:hypothetical protein
VYFTKGPRLYERLAARRLERFVPKRPVNLVFVASNLAWQRYVPDPLDTRVTFYRPQRKPDPRPAPFEGLATEGVELRQIVAQDIDHASMMHEPHVRILADELTRDLADDLRRELDEA